MVRDDLERAVLDAMERASASEMIWGRDDCALWAADILKSALGYDLTGPYRGRYRTKIGARRVMGPLGLMGVLKRASKERRWRRISEGAEQVGDVGLAVTDGSQSIVVCRAPGWFVGRNEAGFTALLTTEVRLMWAVV